MNIKNLRADIAALRGQVRPTAQRLVRIVQKAGEEKEDALARHGLTQKMVDEDPNLLVILRVIIGEPDDPDRVEFETDARMRHEDALALLN